MFDVVENDILDHLSATQPQEPKTNKRQEPKATQANNAKQSQSKQQPAPPTQSQPTSDKITALQIQVLESYGIDWDDMLGAFNNAYSNPESKFYNPHHKRMSAKEDLLASDAAKLIRRKEKELSKGGAK
jgi:hypothetical protein